MGVLGGLIRSSNPFAARTQDFDVAYSYAAQEAIAALLVGHRVEKVTDDALQLDDGTLLKLVGNDGGCSCGSGDYYLTELNGVDNIITSVEFREDDEASNDEYEFRGAYRIFVFADNQRINLATFTGDDGSGYYGTGYDILVRLPKSEKACR